jgi:hypothetical protein
MEENLGIESVYDVIDMITPEQHDILKKIKYGDFLGRCIPFSEKERIMLSTKEGIKNQLDNFVLPHGLIYYIKFDNNIPSVQKRAVYFKKEK